jgi:hypothetical protein
MNYFTPFAVLETIIPKLNKDKKVQVCDATGAS